MGVVLARIDQRLVHGIVVTQVTKACNAQRIMVVDEEVSQDETQKAVMRMSKPAGTGMSIINLETAIANFAKGRYDNHNVLVLVNEPDTLVKMVEGGIKIPKVHVGIVFEKDDRVAVTKHVALNDKEKNDLKRLEELGVEVTFQYTPSDKEEPLSQYVK